MPPTYPSSRSVRTLRHPATTNFCFQRQYGYMIGTAHQRCQSVIFYFFMSCCAYALHRNHLGKAKTLNLVSVFAGLGLLGCRCDNSRGHCQSCTYMDVDGRIVVLFALSLPCRCGENVENMCKPCVDLNVLLPAPAVTRHEKCRRSLFIAQTEPERIQDSVRIRRRWNVDWQLS